MKTCTHCNGRFDESNFPRVKNGRGVLYTRNICKPCWNSRNRAWREEVKENQSQRIVISITSNRPCDGCYRLERCKTEAFECVAFEQWVTEGQFTPAFVGMRERVVAPVLIPSTSLRGTGVEA